MRKTMFSDEILMQLDKPARYIGGEFQSVVKDLDAIDIHFCMCFPDVYEIGMSHLGIQILYGMFNAREDTYCERVYSPWPDADAIMRKEGIPLFSLETQTPIREFDFLGITIQFEMCYTNILQVLDLSGIPLAQEERTWEDPIVIGGGPCTVNIEPMAPFFDLIYIGEGETSYPELLELYKWSKAHDLSRREFLRRAALVPGIYVPSLYQVTYHADGTLKSFAPIEGEVGPAAEYGQCFETPILPIPAKVKRQAVTDFDDVFYPSNPVVPFVKVTQDRVMLEIQRGCIRGCRFCQAGMIYRPNREKNVESLKKQALAMLKSTGHEEISLVSLSTSDYKELEQLILFMLEDLKKRGIEMSLPSLRIDAFSLNLMKKVKGVNTSSLTFAPEAGSQRMRDIINKGLTREEILNGAQMAFESGWSKVKLYFMLGLPFETLEDVQEIPRLANDIAMLYYDTVPKEERKGRCSITMSTSFFVPKPFTPFQWAPQVANRDFLDKSHAVADELKKQLNQRSITYHWHEADTAQLEGALARGDRRMAEVIRRVYEKGSIFDAWGEYMDYDRWVETFAECGLDMDFYTVRPREKDELFPWDYVDCGVSKAFLWREWEKAKNGVVTLNCREKCAGCGATSYGGGVCHD